MRFSRTMILCILLAAAGAASAYTVILNNGKKVEGTFVEDRGSAIVLKDRDGVLLTFRKSTLNLDKMREANSEESEPPVAGSVPPPSPAVRQETGKPGKPKKVYTNEDLKDLPDLAVAGSEEPVDLDEEKPVETPPVQEKHTKSFDEEAYWMSQTREIGKRLRQVEADYEYLKKACDDARQALTYYVLNGYMGTNLAVAQDAAYYCDQANQAKAEWERQQKALEDFQDRARREGALPGWVDPDRVCKGACR